MICRIHRSLWCGVLLQVDCKSARELFIVWGWFLTYPILPLPQDIFGTHLGKAQFELCYDPHDEAAEVK